MIDLRGLNSSLKALIARRSPCLTRLFDLYCHSSIAQYKIHFKAAIGSPVVDSCVPFLITVRCDKLEEDEVLEAVLEIVAVRI